MAEVELNKYQKYKHHILNYQRNNPDKMNQASKRYYERKRQERQQQMEADIIKRYLTELNKN